MPSASAGPPRPESSGEPGPTVPSHPRRLLMIAYEFAPVAGGGVARIVSYARFLRDHGWEPIVLTAAPGYGRPRDPALLSLIEGVEIVRLPSRNIIWTLAYLGAPLRWLAARLRRPRSSVPNVASTDGKLRSPLTTRIARRVTFPDEAALWAHAVQRVAPAICRRSDISAILASGPPFSALVAAADVGRTTGLPVVLDMRDQWRDNVGIVWPTPALAERAADLERRTLSSASAVVGATDGIVAEATDMGAALTETIHNGFDPEQMPPHRPDPSGPLSIAFLGRFSRDVMDPTPFFRGLAEAVSRDPLAAAIRVEVVGPEAPWVGALVRGLGLADAVTFHGFQAYHDALEIVSHADVGLMTVSDRPGSAELYPGKLFDYLGVGVPLLFVGPSGGGVAQLVRENAMGVVVRHDDVTGVADAVVAMARAKAAGEALTSPDPVAAARFDRRAQVARLAGMLDRVTGDRG